MRQLCAQLKLRFPIIASLVIACLSIVIFIQLKNSQKMLINQSLDVLADITENDIENDFSALVGSIQATTHGFDNEEVVTENLFRKETARIFRTHSSVYQIGFFDTKHQLLWNDQRSAQELSLWDDKRIKSELSLTLEKAVKTREEGISKIIFLKPESSLLLLSFPSFSGKKFLGSLSVVLELGTFFHRDLLRLTKMEYAFDIDQDGTHIFENYKNQQFSEHLSEPLKHGVLSLRYFSLNYTIWSNSPQHIGPYTYVPYFVLFFGLILSIFFGATIRYARISNTRLYDLEESNKKLKDEVEQRKKAEGEMFKAKNVAERANETKSMFLANMSHEIRTPLGIILGFAEIIMKEELSDTTRRLHAASILRSGEGLLALVNDILDLSRVESGSVSIETENAELIPLVKETIYLLTLKAKEKNVDLKLSWATPVPKIIKTDSLRLKQVLLNVVGNAIKFTEHGTVTVVVKLAREPDEAGKNPLHFDVLDTGSGIPKSMHEKIFSPFTQVDGSMTRRHGGTGLGLTLARQLARKLGGDVTLTMSQTGIGSCFSITIDAGPYNLDQLVPINDIAPLLSTPTDSLSQSVQQPLRANSALRILITDDCIDMQTLLKTHLENHNFVTDIATNGYECLHLAETQSYNLILMDMQMPGIDGYETTRRLRNQGYSGPILALTAHAMKGERDRCIAAGCTEYLSKPFQLAHLNKQIFDLTSQPAQNAVGRISLVSVKNQTN